MAPRDTSSTDELAARADDQPAAAVLEHVLAEDLPGALVADVVVERPAGVRDLAAAVRALDRAEQGALSVGADDRSAIVAGASNSASRTTSANLMPLRLPSGESVTS